MIFFILSVFFTLSASVFVEDWLVTSCILGDHNCFMQAISDCRVKPDAAKLLLNHIQPVYHLTTPFVNMSVLDDEVHLYYQNVHVVGLKDLKFVHLDVDKEEKHVQLTTELTGNFFAELIIEVPSAKSDFKGVYMSKGVFTINLHYDYKVVKDSTETEYFVVDAKSIETSCVGVDEPIMSLNENLNCALENDSVTRVLRDRYNRNKVEYRHDALCRAVISVFETAVNNLKVASRALPGITFF